MVSLPKTMKAWVIARNGPPEEALELETERPTPANPKGSDIIVKVLYAALNPADIMLMQSAPTWVPFFRRKPTPGLDFCGEVVAVGPTVGSSCKIGDMVCGAISVGLGLAGRGTLAEFVTVPAELAVPAPEEASLLTSAGVGGIAGQTAALVLNEAKIKKGDRVLINGASGGVGSLLLQVAKAQGAVVIAVCSSGNVEMVKRLGADDVIDYLDHAQLEEFLADKYKEEPLDFIFDCVGHSALGRHSARYLGRDGKMLNIVGGTPTTFLAAVRNQVLPTFLGGSARYFRTLVLFANGKLAAQSTKWLRDGSLKEMPIDTIFSLDEVPLAYKRLATKRARGKVVINVQA